MPWGSDVFVSFLDLSRAFDKISHHGLFLKLMDRCVPLYFLLIVIFWYSNTRSYSFRVLCGSKQGGILSPNFFSIYINDLVILLRSSKIGCHILNRFIACILFADDLSLLAPTRGSLQKLLNICFAYCEFFSRVSATLWFTMSVGLSVGWSVGPKSLHFFLLFCAFE